MEARIMKKTLSQLAASLALLFLSVASLPAADRHVLHHRTHAAVANLTPLGRLPATNRLNLVIGLPLRHQADFALLRQQLYDPASPNFHRYLTPAQLTARFVRRMPITKRSSILPGPMGCRWLARTTIA